MPSVTQRLKSYKGPRGLSARQHYVRSKYAENADFIAVVSFHGKIPDGSEGRLYAEFITLQCIEALVRLEANCIIIDFRDVHYAWGNSLLRVFDTIEKYLHYEWHDIEVDVPIKLVASDKSSGLFSLIANSNMFFETTELAIASCCSDLELWMPE